MNYNSILRIIQYIKDIIINNINASNIFDFYKFIIEWILSANFIK